MTRTTTLLAAMCAVLLMAISATAAENEARVRGVISAVDGSIVKVKPAKGAPVELHLQENSQLVFNKPMAISEIRQGDFLAVTSSLDGNGTLTALEVRRFPKPINPGHRPFDGRSDQTMTNAAVSAIVESAKGREITVTYKDGSQKITVPENIPILTQVPGKRSDLKTGVTVFAVAEKGADGRLTVLRMQYTQPH